MCGEMEHKTPSPAAWATRAELKKLEEKMDNNHSALLFIIFTITLSVLIAFGAVWMRVNELAVK